MTTETQAERAVPLPENGREIWDAACAYAKMRAKCMTAAIRGESVPWDEYERAMDRLAELTIGCKPRATKQAVVGQVCHPSDAFAEPE